MSEISLSLALAPEVIASFCPLSVVSVSCVCDKCSPCDPGAAVAVTDGRGVGVTVGSPSFGINFRAGSMVRCCFLNSFSALRCSLTSPERGKGGWKSEAATEALGEGEENFAAFAGEAEGTAPSGATVTVACDARAAGAATVGRGVGVMIGTGINFLTGCATAGAVGGTGAVGAMTGSLATVVAAASTGLTKVLEGALGGGVDSLLIFMRTLSAACRSVIPSQPCSTTTCVTFSFTRRGRSTVRALRMAGAVI